MARYSSDHKDETRRKIVKSAGRLFRKKGYQNTSVETVMKAVDLTPGGFYAHFSSKEALFVASLAESMRSARKRGYANELDAGLSSKEWLRSVLERVLSRGHRDNWEIGCPLATSVSEVGRGTPTIRKQFEQEVEANLAVIIERIPGRSADEKRRNAIFLVTVLLGAINLARALPTDSLSQEVLQASIRSVLDLLEAR